LNLGVMLQCEYPRNKGTVFREKAVADWRYEDESRASENRSGIFVEGCMFASLDAVSF
jgi:hypothetical protein